ncbi:hypothetical protein AAA799B03_00971 [Marine Group I thaumarchaeote SCGC AAA799-B03]|uniref:Novel STAND NTPase 5 domain-containing protein n=3 Tax=Marine Group I TaxID=905826 RepID=A0A087S6W8_9ARCH|nr:hypothetical protein AAA799N04_00828 [Marine Group I thaumarchaeote SCGC AAA799-N04]KFM19208.1 hypothetical protein SCCGRSA3_00793 [Marine Group I thaumarchaeote SCGC RSA3]KFM21472.1 hypothetical protein AAA799B03_00971 [Marine Group I thaumarchaeote SCGC AAA799-B03]
MLESPVDIQTQELVDHMQELKPEYDTNEQQKITLYPYKDKKIPILQILSLDGIIKRILTHNQKNHFSSLLLIGKSGSGKTTLTKRIMHGIHTKGHNYNFHWFTGEDMFDIDKIIKQLTIGQNHFVCFDDASYTLEDARKADLGRLANALTKIRHDVQGRCIVSMNIHYSKATKKFFRDVDWTFCTSLTQNDKSNLADLFSDERIVSKFASKYRSSMLNNFFSFPLFSYSGKDLFYKTNEPFRVGLVCEINHTHHFVYDKLDCEICNKDAYNTQKRQLLSAKEIVDEASASYPLSHLGKCMRFFAFLRDGNLMSLTANDRKFWKFLCKLAQRTDIPFSDVIDEVENRKTNKSARWKHVGITEQKMQENLQKMIDEKLEKNTAEY